MPLLRTHWLQGSRKHYHFYKNRNSPSALSFSFVVHIHMILKTIWRAVFFVADEAAVRGEVDSVSVIYVPAEAMAGAQNFGTDWTLVSGAPCPCCHGGRRTPQPVPKQPVHVCNKQHNPSVPPLLPPRPAPPLPLQVIYRVGCGRKAGRGWGLRTAGARHPPGSPCGRDSCGC